MRSLFLTMFFAQVAEASYVTYISEAVEAGDEVVLQVEALDTTCEGFSVSEDAYRRSSYRTLVSVEQVVTWPERNTSEPLIVGESVELSWSDYDEGPFWPESDGCQSEHYSFIPGDRRPVVVQLSDGRWSIATYYIDDTGTATGGSGELPPCGEAEQAEVIRAIDPALGGDADAQGPSDSSKEGGCATTGGVGAAPLGGLLVVAGLALRRRRP